MRMKWTFFLLLIFSAFACAEDQPEALVETGQMHLAYLHSTLAAYGTAISDPKSTVSVSLARPGQIARLDVTAGKKVRKGASLFEFATDPNASHGYVQAETSLEMARSSFESMKRLHGEQLATNAQLAAAEQGFKDAESAFDAQKKLGTGSNRETIRAPFDGVVTGLFFSPGDRIQAGKTVLQLSRLDALRVVIGIEPEDASRIKPGMEVRLFPVFAKSAKLEGTISEIGGGIDPQTRLVDVLVRIGEPKNLIPGMKLKGEIVIPAGQNWVVPRSAVLQDEKGAYIFQVENGHARRIGVVATEYGEIEAIQGKFDPRLPVVLLGNYELKDGMKLREGAR